MSAPIDPRNPLDQSATEEDKVVWALKERVKELTALHGAARVLEHAGKTPATILKEIVALLPPAWQYPEITAVKISLGAVETATPNFARTPWSQMAMFSAGEGAEGLIEVVYLEDRPALFEGPFLQEERALIQSLAQMLASYFERQAAEEKARNAYNDLECQVRDRTADLERTNQTLRDEISERLRAEEAIRHSQAQLRRLATELTLAEERERRTIASDLHDHIGQALAVIRARLRQMQSSAMFSGMEKDIEDTLALLDQTIQSTRTLTFEISPPVLYDLGLEPALQWLCRQFQKKHGLRAEMTSEGSGPLVPDDIQITVFRSVQELLLNAVKHARASAVRVHLVRMPTALRVEVRDDGEGYDFSREGASMDDHGGFGLLSIRERLRVLGGALRVTSSPGRGAAFILDVPLAGSAWVGGKP
ncbi:MAG: sensor histidine kinase [Candidatus Aminicenantes bacterium]|nr:sensor histidine kinase [Candidatus Aminicenantes bacterium]